MLLLWKVLPGEDENYVLSDIYEVTNTTTTYLSDIGTRASDFEYVGRTVAANVDYTFLFEPTDTLTDNPPPPPDVTGGSNGNTTDLTAQPGLGNLRSSDGSPDGQRISADGFG